MSWRSVLDGIDAVESWIAGVSYWVQVTVLLAVLLPAAWGLAGLIDRIVEKILWPRTRREIRSAVAAATARSHAETPAPPTARPPAPALPTAGLPTAAGSQRPPA